MARIKVRKGMPSVQLDKATFALRLEERFYDPAFAPLRGEIDKIIDAAWDGYDNSRKSPVTHPAGAGFADPTYELSDQWRAARDAVRKAEQRQRSPASKPRILLINGSPRSEHTCPGEMSKTFRLTGIAEEVFRRERFEVERLDLNRQTSEFGIQIHPCKGCVSTAMPLCHWPCSGNPDPTSTSGKDAQKAKDLEMKGWDYPRHLAGRAYAVVVHGDAAGAETLRRSLSDWLADMGLLSAGHKATIDRYVGYYEPYAESHPALDADRAVQEETRNAARALVKAVKLMRAGKLPRPDADLADPRPK